MLIGEQYYQKLIPGEYAIIYTRPVGENFGDTSKSALVDPNLSKATLLETLPIRNYTVILLD